jgi:hypothetical protein
MSLNINVIRKQVWHYINPSTASAADMTVGQIKQFIAGSFTPSDEQLQRLSRRMQMSEVD